METSRSTAHLFRAVMRHRPWIVAVVSVGLIALVPAHRDHSSSTAASTGPAAAVGSGTGDPGVAANAGTSDTVASAPGTQTTGGQGAANAGAKPHAGPTASSQLFGSPEALAAPDCDSARGRLKVPIPWAPPCAIPWPKDADNGGATYQGVTKDKIRIVITYTNNAQDDSVKAWPDNAAPYEKAYRMWGRTVEPVYFQLAGTGDEASERADAIKIADLKPFAVWTPEGGSAVLVLNQELANRGIVVITANVPAKNSLVRPGYIWGATLPPNDPNLPQTAEYVGKRLLGKPAKWAGDPTLAAQPRKFGLIYPDDWDLGKFKSEFAKYGGSVVDAISYTNNYDLTTYQERARLIVSRLKDKGVNSVIAASDGVLDVFLSQQATAQAWFPEWVIAAVGGSDVDLLARLADQQQWRHAFGLSMLPAPVQNEAPATMFDWYWGNQAGQKTRGNSTFGVKWAAFTIYTGLHMAGPNLNPQTWAAGMFAFPASGGISCNCVTSQQISWGRHGVTTYDDFNAWDDFTEVWWDPTFVGRGNDGIADGTPGHYRYMDGGKRRLPGQWPTGEPPAFDAAQAAPINTIPQNERVPNYPCDGCPGR